MKRLILLPLIGLHGIILLSQNKVDVYIDQPEILTADAGRDTTIDVGSTIQLGGSPTAIFGYEGYTFSWTPSAILSDAFVSNPNATLQNSGIFMVTVTDAMGCTSVDSIQVTVVDATYVPGSLTVPELEVYPNPTRGEFIIRLDNIIAVNSTEVIIRNMNGKVVYRRSLLVQKGKNYIPVYTNSLPSGNYFLEIVNPSLHSMHKLVVY